MRLCAGDFSFPLPVLTRCVLELLRHLREKQPNAKYKRKLKSFLEPAVDVHLAWCQVKHLQRPGNEAGTTLVPTAICDNNVEAINWASQGTDLWAVFGARPVATLVRAEERRKRRWKLMEKGGRKEDFFFWVEEGGEERMDEEKGE